jgi:hypothetical protein
MAAAGGGDAAADGGVGDAAGAMGGVGGADRCGGCGGGDAAQIDDQGWMRIGWIWISDVMLMDILG